MRVPEDGVTAGRSELMIRRTYGESVEPHEEKRLLLLEYPQTALLKILMSLQIPVNQMYRYVREILDGMTIEDLNTLSQVLSSNDDIDPRFYSVLVYGWLRENGFISDQMNNEVQSGLKKITIPKKSFPVNPSL